MKPQQEVSEQMRKQAQELFQAEQEKQKNSHPVCPYCKADPMGFDASDVDFAGFRFVQIFCANPKCRKFFNLTFIGRIKPKKSELSI